MTSDGNLKKRMVTSSREQSSGQELCLHSWTLCSTVKISELVLNNPHIGLLCKMLKNPCFIHLDVLPSIFFKVLDVDFYFSTCKPFHTTLCFMSTHCVRIENETTLGKGGE